MAHNISYLLSFLAILAALQLTTAVDYTVTNTAASTPGGVRFNNAIGLDYSKRVLAAATRFTRDTFGPNRQDYKKDVASISLFVDNMNGVAYTTSNNEIHISANYIQRYSGDVKNEITGVLIHEVAHIWQWNGVDQAPRGLIEGIADYIRLKAGYAPSHWVQPGQGDKWAQGYDVTARFLDYCNDLSDTFVADLNKKMRFGYNNRFFVELLGKTVEQLWAEYKAYYKN